VPAVSAGEGVEEERIRAASPNDHDAIVALAAAALGWDEADPNEALFRWKHLDNPFGPSGMWVAEGAGGLVAFRALLRWEFDAPDGRRRHAVRAVDTATHPAHQGRGWFRRLTTHGLDEVRADGADFVFNTPNDQSRPGYLKMGWEVVGRVPVAVGLRSPAAARRMLAARVPAGKWSLETGAGESAADVLGEDRALDSLAGLLGSQPHPTGLRTARTPAFLRWRYAGGPITYRVLLRGASVEEGIACFRLRARGAAVEATLCDLIVPDDDPSARAELLRSVRRAARPDYLIRVQRPLAQNGLVRLPGQGPLMTWRALRPSTMPPLDAWDLRLGDIELF
jgi:GNAT superfamily N-acetyltransferase